MSNNGFRRRFSRQFKMEAVRQVEEAGKSVAELAEELDIHPNMLYRWRKKYQDKVNGNGNGNGGLSQAHEVNGIEGDELQRLRYEVKRLKQERETLKKAIIYLAREGFHEPMDA